MYKLVVLFALVAVAAAKPSGLGYSAVFAPAVAHAEVYAPIAVAPSAVSSTYRKDVISEPIVTYAAPQVVAAPVVHRTVVAAPVVVPAAVSHTYRSDIISKPIIAHAAPVLAYSAHVPAIHAW